MKKETGGPAFPELGNVGCNSDWQSESGMTLRDYFAAKAMQGRLANPDWLCSEARTATEAYQMADAMLEARNK